MTDPARFRQAMAQFASGVTVVTTVKDGVPSGLTASSFASLSIEPPLLLVCLQKTLGAHRIIEETGIFAVNVLASRQLDIGRRFAGLQPETSDRFTGTEWMTAVTGSPVLPGCLAWADCRVWNIYDGGDHSIFVGAVEEVSASDDGEPLLYHNRLWGRGLFRE
jgi:flavin reductase (DIM6/NTAB) family NADH-FMN oxidoreductase RutF